MNETLLKGLFLILLLPGIAGTILPFVPGLFYMLLVSVLFSVFLFHFSYPVLIVLFLLSAAGFAVEHTAGAVSTRYFGGSKRSLYLGALALFFGTLFFPPFGGLIAMFAAIFISEMEANSGKKQAFEAAAGSVAGSLAGRMVLFLLSLVFFTVCFAAVVF